MGWLLATWLLAPVLWVQGRRVRRETPKLAEAAGAREGVAGRGPPWRLLVLGDSAAAGVGVGHQDDALAGRLVAELAVDRTVSWRLDARTGDGIDDLLARVGALPAEPCDAVVVAIGVNDVTGRTRPAAWRTRLVRLLDAIDDRFGSPRVFVCAIPPMQAFPALPQPLARWLGAAAARLNRTTQAVVAARPRAVFVAFDLDPDSASMCDDGFHPSAAGYRRWAGALAQRMRVE